MYVLLSTSAFLAVTLSYFLIKRYPVTKKNLLIIILVVVLASVFEFGITYAKYLFISPDYQYLYLIFVAVGSVAVGSLLIVSTVNKSVEKIISRILSRER